MDWYDQLRTTDGHNHGRWFDPTYDQLVMLGDQALGNDERLRLYQQAQEEVTAQAPVAVMYQSVARFEVSRRAQLDLPSDLLDADLGPLPSPNWLP